MYGLPAVVQVPEMLPERMVWARDKNVEAKRQAKIAAAVSRFVFIFGFVLHGAVERKRREPDAPAQRHREAPGTQIRQAAPVWGVGLPAVSKVIKKFAVSCATFRLR